MKRVFVLFVLSFVIVTASFGTDLELGFGGGINYQGTFNMKWKESVEHEWGTINNNGFGAFLFFDATYAEFSLFFNFSRHTWSFDEDQANDYSGTENAFTFEMELLGKYPFYFDSFVLFPLLGISYETPFWGGGMGIMAGIGADFNLTERLYLRGEILYGIRLIQVGIGKLYDSRPGHIPRIKLGIGYSFMGFKTR